MSKLSSISVVISAYCDEQGLRLTVQSIFRQLEEKGNADLLLEIIIVEDGAEQAVKDTLLELQRLHSEIIVINQDNMGLTKALITACELAKYDYIARVDVGDCMLATRLRKQIDYLQTNLDVVGVATRANIVTSEGYSLYQVNHTNQEIEASLQPKKLSTVIAKNFTSPQHYTMLFRKSAYDRVGGYRPEFYFAQDVDLWLRMSEHGDIRIIEEQLTSSTFSENSLSSANNRTQQNLRDLAWQAAVLRRQGQSDHEILQKAMLIRPKSSEVITQSAQSKSLYFIAKCLLDQGHFGAKQYFWEALKKQPFSVKYWLGFMQSLLVNESK